jgi:hypothetical protein
VKNPSLELRFPRSNSRFLCADVREPQILTHFSGVQHSDTALKVT